MVRDFFGNQIFILDSYFFLPSFPDVNSHPYFTDTIFPPLGSLMKIFLLFLPVVLKCLSFKTLQISSASADIGSYEANNFLLSEDHAFF